MKDLMVIVGHGLFAGVFIMMIAVFLGSMMHPEDVAHAETSSQHKCVKACNEHWTKEYIACHSVPQCESYVEREAAVCIRHCGQ
jgi:hypothetical protein